MSDRADEIMDAAEHRIRAAGYDGFSFREIATDVGVKSASVHYHFPTKEKLAAAVARRYTERFMAAVDEDMAGGADVIGAWVAAFERALHRDGKMCLCGALGATSGNLPVEVLVEARRFFELGLEKLVEGGLSQTRAMQVMAALEGAMLLANVFARPEVFEESISDIY